MLVEGDAKHQRIRAACPSLANLSPYFLGQTFDLVREIDRKGNHVLTPNTAPALELIRASADKRSSFEHSLRKGGIGWQDQGNQWLVTPHATRKAIAEPNRQFKKELREIEELQSEGGVTGFRTLTANGMPGWFQSGPESKNHRTEGPASAVGECLRATQSHDKLGGFALGTQRTITLRGKPFATQTADSEYTLKSSSEFTTLPIHRASDTIQISPRKNVFTDPAEISFGMPI
ncbi:MAG: hypothetical protein RLZZ142_209 [Verrucomicrobiota bacterium]